MDSRAGLGSRRRALHVCRAPATLLSPFLRQSLAHLAVYGERLQETGVSFNLACEMDCQALAGSRWEVSTGNSAPGLAGVMTCVMMVAHKSQGAPTPSPGSFRNVQALPLPRNPIQWLGRNAIRVQCIAIPFYRCGESWLAKLCGKNNVSGFCYHFFFPSSF